MPNDRPGTRAGGTGTPRYQRTNDDGGDGRPKSPVAKRSLKIKEHKTSVSLEAPFWSDLRAIARERNVTLSELVAGIDSEREHGNLSSAIRLFVLQHWRGHQQQANTRESAEVGRAP